MRIITCVKGLETIGIGKQTRGGWNRSAREEEVRDGVEATWTRGKREEQWNEVALKLGQVYSVSVSPLIDPPSTHNPCGSTYRQS